MTTVNVGINGFGRIGKCCFLQVLQDSTISLKAININNLKIENLQQYINNDSIHGKQNYEVEILDDNYVKINNQIIKIFKSKNPGELLWEDYDIEYLFETTGAFLTQEKAKTHKVKYMCMSAPPKDLGITPIFCYGVNENNYNGEAIISNASCTTNCIAPFLKVLEKYGIHSANFITIHSATSSQSVVDTANFNKRTNRSIFNNIIPHTTGATSSLKYILPDLENKVVGTSVRIPTSNVSMVDMNVTFTKQITKEILLHDLSKLQNDVICVNNENLVSSDFIGTSHPTIIDYASTFQIDENSIKFTLWYDNEWSYTAQMIKIVKTMFQKNNSSSLHKISNVNCHNKVVVVRCDFNCPVNNGTIEDDYRIQSALPTLTKILLDKPSKLILMTHFGRPKAQESEFSTKLFLSPLNKYLNEEIGFLPNGLLTTNEELNSLENINKRVYLMENVRFHNFETDTSIEYDMNFDCDVYCNEAFSASHRNHYSITKINAQEHCYGNCFVKEIDTFNMILKSNNSKVIAIIGGSKVSDKIPMLEKLSTIVDYIFVAGNNLNSLEENKPFFDSLKNNKAEILYAEDGFGNYTPNLPPSYIENIDENDKNNKYNIFDIGPKSLNTLTTLINDSSIVFWNGTLGISEHDFYKNSSELLVQILNNCQSKVIIGGGDTAGFVRNYENNFHHISTGGGASIDYISNAHLDGIKYQ